MSHHKSPFKFLDPYGREDREVFFGRDKETDELYDALSGVKHLLIYGPSGAGKTSLVECGLRNQFSDADWFALTVRRDGDITASIFSKINEALEEKIKLNPKTNLPLNENIGFGQAIENLFAERYQPVYLLFDQFEELLILGSDEEKKDFFIRLNKLIRYKVPCRVMLIMREEFIGHLSEFEHLCPSIFQHRFRLEKMGRTKVREVILHTLQAPGHHSFFRVENAGQLADSILAKLPDERREIELTHVQVFLDELWARARKNNSGGGPPVLKKGLIKKDDNLETVLHSFLKKQLGELEKTYGEKIPLKLLAAMISERHTKLQLGESDLKKELNEKGIVPEKPLPGLLSELEKRRILRTLKSGEKTKYEISHDILAEVVGKNLPEEIILQKKAGDIYKVYQGRKGFFSQDDLDYIRPFKQYKKYPPELEKRIGESEVFLREKKEKELKKIQQQAEKERRLREQAEVNEKKAQERTRLAVILFGVALLAFVVAGYFGWNAYNSKNQFQAALKKANKLVKTYYFYDGKFALAERGKGRRLEETNHLPFYYINNNGDEITRLGRWKKANQFDEKGFARVQNSNSEEFLLDTLGNTYRIISDLKDMNTNITALDLSKKGMTKIPKEVFKQFQLKVLFLDNNKISVIPPEIGLLKNMTTFYLNSNKLTDLPPEIGDLKNLKQLYLNDNQIANIPSNIGRLGNLRVLELSENQLTTIPKNIGQLINLEVLRLNNNRLTSLPVEISQLRNIESITFNGNDLITIPEIVNDFLSGLADISEQELKLPDNPEKITSLDLSDKDLRKLPLEISGLENLQKLDLSGNHHLDLKDAFLKLSRLNNLKELNLSNNGLTYLPKEIGLLKNLTNIYLRRNQFASPPSEIWQLKNLGLVTLKNNPLMLVNSSFGEYLKNKSDLSESEIDLLVNPKNRTSFELSSNNLTELPIEIWQLENLEKLELRLVPNLDLQDAFLKLGKLNNLANLTIESCKLTVIPSEITQLKGLTHLYLKNNKLEDLPSSIGQLKELRYLDLSNNNLRNLPSDINSLTGLVHLDLSDNGIESLPKQIGALKNLEELNLSRNKLMSLSPKIGRLKNLRILNLEYNKLQGLTSGIGGLENLEQLNLSQNNLMGIPPEIGQLKHLDRLDLTWNKLENLPAQIGTLKNLTILEMAFNNLTSIPPEIGQLENLEQLYLRFNLLTDIPSQIGMLKNLKTLDLGEEPSDDPGFEDNYINNIKRLPHEIGMLENLTELYLGGINLKKLPSEIQQLQDLKILNLKDNQLSVLPSGIGQLVNLEKLNLDNNQLVVLPSEIGQLINLKSFNLNHNKLAVIPPEIGQLANLNNFFLNNNRITALPAEVGELVNIKKIYLKNNQLTVLPLELWELDNLEELHLEENPLSISEKVNLVKKSLSPFHPKRKIYW